MLEAAGYEREPTKALTMVGKSQKVPESTLRSWWNRLHKTGKLPMAGTITAKDYEEKKFDLRAAIRKEIEAVFTDMTKVRIDASYKDLAWAAGVFIDKDRLLDDKPTAIIKLEEAFEKGAYTPEEARKRWPKLMQKYDNLSA